MLTEKETQIKLGNATEKNICKVFKNHKYWVYNLPKKANGQPCDVVALKDNISWFVDGKHVRNEAVSFTFDRIEPNQLAAMEYAKNFAGLKNVGFVIFFDRTKKLYWFSYDKYIYMKRFGKKSVNYEELEEFESLL